MMVKNKFLIALLLISMSFSMLNAFVIDANEIEHCSAQEYVQEFSQSHHCGDLCDVRYMFHISFILPVHAQIIALDNRVIPLLCTQKDWISDYTFSTFRPPIAS